MGDFATRVIPLTLLDAADASAPQVATQEICGDYVWSLQIVATGLDAQPVWKVEYSNDNINFHVYNAHAVIVDGFTNAFYDDIWPFLYFRISYIPKQVTAGTVSALMILKVK